jgi:hypothetical protein
MTSTEIEVKSYDGWIIRGKSQLAKAWHCTLFRHIWVMPRQDAEVIVVAAARAGGLTG